MCKKSVFYIYSILILSLLLVSCSKNKLVIINEGASNYEIIITDNANEAVQKAASELQFYLEKQTSVKLNIKTHKNQTNRKRQIIIGGDNFPNQLQNHEIAIKTSGKNIFISGGNPQSTLYAVYEFLERYTGCRWYSPKIEKIPLIKKLSIKSTLNYSYIPDITTRTVHSVLFYQNHDFADKHHVTHDAFPDYVPSARVHTFHRFMPEKDFYKNHPEYYALRGNKRLATQLCLTNADVLQIVTDSVKAYFERFPESDVISVSQDDNTQYCQCEACAKIDNEEGSPSGTMIRFVNDVAKSFPNKTISTLAYQYTRSPSKTQPANNVLITLCSIECDRSAPIEQKCSAFAEDLIGWKGKTPNIRIWDYTTQFTNFLAPFPNLMTLQPNIRFFMDNNARWVFEQHSHNPSELFELRSYLMAKLLWNPDADVEQLITDFTDGYYEKAGVYVKKYIDRIHTELHNNSTFFLYLYGDPAQAFNSFLKPELLLTYDSIFNEAEKAVSQKPDILQRVKTARLSTDYAILEASKKALSPELNLIVNNNGVIEVSANVLQRLDNFKSTCLKNDITLMNEMGFSVEEYLLLSNKTIERAILPNKAKNKKVTLLTKPKKYANENPQTLTDGAFGGNSFYSDWLGFEGKNFEAIIDLGVVNEISNISTAFLQVTNHIVFFPEQVDYFSSSDGITFKPMGSVPNAKPLFKKSTINDIEYFDLKLDKVKTRYVKVVAKNMGTAPIWHNAAGLPVWIFTDEIIIN